MDNNNAIETKIEDREVAFFFFHFHNQYIVLNACHLHESQDPEKKQDTVFFSGIFCLYIVGFEATYCKKARCKSPANFTACTSCKTR